MLSFFSFLVLLCTNCSLIQAFVSCRLDCCNSLLYGVSDDLMRKLQSIQNAAARLITGARRYDHIMHVLRQLQWLPVRRRVDFKIACLAHQSLSGLAPAYLADDINLVADQQPTGPCVVPRTHNTFGFTAAGPLVWNNLPSQL